MQLLSTRYAADMRTLWMILTGIAEGFTLPNADPTQPPPLRFDVLIDGEPHTLVDGKKTAIKIGGVEHSMTVSTSPVRHFAAAGVEFDYPRDALFEYSASEDSGLKTWTIESRNQSFMLYLFPFGGADEMPEVMANAALSVTDANVKAKPRELILGGKTYEGMGGKATTTHTGLDITSVGLMLDDETLVISVQNTLSEMGEAETDSIATLAVIQKTFRLSK